MSKIYEALLRAEKEKAAYQKNSSQEWHSTERTSSEFPVSEEFARSNGSDGTSRLVDSSEPDSSLRIPPLPPPSLQIWAPNLDALPALRSRGAKVEQFRSLRSKLTGLRHTQKVKSIYIGSGHAGEGKSFIASNLAVALARHKSTRVLLVDGDLRRGTLHKVLGCPNEVGLAEYLNGKATMSDILQQGQPVEGGEPLPSGLANLTFCPCGHARDRAAELSASSQFPKLIRAVANEFDWIIVDSSPVNIVADGVNLARACDSAMLVVRGGETKLETAQRAVQELKAAKILGVVLNAVSELTTDEGHYAYQGYDSLDL